MRKTLLFGCVMALGALPFFCNAQSSDSSMTDSLLTNEGVKTKAWDKEHPFEINTKPVKIVPYGFIRNDFYYDSRENFETASGLFYVIPKDKDLNALGEDLNDVSSSRFLSIATRVGVKVFANKPILKSNLMTQVETDFAGYSGSTTMLRIRQAFVKMDWKKWSLLAGQTWHPMFGSVVPEVQSLATGCPFQPFNRSPQVRIDAKTVGKRGTEFRAFASAIYQFQYASVGPEGSTSKYQLNAKVPEAYLGFELKKGGFLFGVGAELTTIKPRNYATKQVTPDSTYTHCSDELVISMAWNAYLQYITPNGKFRVRAKSIYGGNMSHLLLLSGYAVGNEEDEGEYTYWDVKTWTSWLNVVYGTKWQVGVFGGYMTNLGIDSHITSPDQVYMFGYNNVAGTYRIAPMLCYNLKHFSFGVEYELTATSYGTWENDKDLSYASLENTHWVKNNRVVAVMMLHF